MEANITDSSKSSNDSRTTFGYIDLAMLPAYVLVIIIGLGGNSLVITVVKKKRSMHTTTNYLLANLAVADLMNLIWCIPGLVLTFVEHPDGRLGNLLCKFVTRHTVAGIAQLVSGLTLTVLAVERYKALFYPLTEKFRLTRKNVRYPIVILWVFAVVYVIPLIVHEEFNEQHRLCSIMWKSLTHAMVYWVILAVIAIASSLIILFCYFNIIRGLYFTKTICSQGSVGSSTGFSPNGTARKDEDKIEKRKIVKLLLVVTVIFFVCYIPFVVVSALILNGISILYKLCYFLVYCSSSLNPLVYATHSSNFREAFSEILSKFSDDLHCSLTKYSRNRFKISEFEIRATYHRSESDDYSQQPVKLLSVKKIQV